MTLQQRKTTISYVKRTAKTMIVALCFCCNTKSQSSEANTEPLNENKEINVLVNQGEAIHNKDSSYQYENRTGSSGHYEYTYDVTGHDADSNEVSGSITIQGKQGTGILTDTQNNEIEVDVEWIDYGKLKATDENGNEYELEVI